MMKKSVSKRIGSLALALMIGSVSMDMPSERHASAASLIGSLQVADTENAADWCVQSNLQAGAVQFGDRDVTYETLPDFLCGADYIRTAADSKAYAGNLGSFTAGAEISAYVALDDRVSTPPAWLSGWADTGENLTNSNDVVFCLYRASFQKGEMVTLGTNGQSAGCVNYTVMATAGAGGFLPGDVNADDRLTAADADMLQSWLVQDGTLPNWKAGDFSGDARLNALDLSLLKRSVLKASTESSTTTTTTETTTSSITTTTTVAKETIADGQPPFQVADKLFNQNDTDTLSLSAPDGLATYSVWSATSSSDHYCNGVCVAAYGGKLYCQWQSSAQDEDSADTHVMYAVSADHGRTWTAPAVLAENIGDGYCTSGGWLATGSQLVAYINFWPTDLSPRGGFTYYMTTQDGSSWSSPRQVMMADNTPMNGVFEQDPHVLASGRIINAAHFQAGLMVCPIYTDDPNGITGWKKGNFTATASGSASVEMEPSSFVQNDGTIVMIFRDQQSSYTKLASYSQDDGVTWSKAVATEMPDARTKQSAGNLSDGTAFMVGCPVNNSLRSPLAVTVSKDGKTFRRAFLIRSNASDPELIYEGKAKRKGFHYVKCLVADGNLYVVYATNKEVVEISVIPEASLAMN